MLKTNGTLFVILVIMLMISVAPARTQRTGQADSRRWKIVFVSDRDGHNEVYVMDPDGSNQQRLTFSKGEGVGRGFPDWSPDRQKIAFNSGREENAPREIYVMSSDGSNVKRLNARGCCPAWSPDGKRIAFASNRDGNSDNLFKTQEIYTMDTDGSNVRRLTHTTYDAINSSPVWSPDGKKIAFPGRAQNSIESTEIYVMDADGSNLQRLTLNKFFDGAPHW